MAALSWFEFQCKFKQQQYLFMLLTSLYGLVPFQVRCDGKMRRRDLATGKLYIGAYSPSARAARVRQRKLV